METPHNTYAIEEEPRRSTSFSVIQSFILNETKICIFAGISLISIAGSGYIIAQNLSCAASNASFSIITAVITTWGNIAFVRSRNQNTL